MIFFLFTKKCCLHFKSEKYVFQKSVVSVTSLKYLGSKYFKDLKIISGTSLFSEDSKHIKFQVVVDRPSGLGDQTSYGHYKNPVVSVTFILLPLFIAESIFKISVKSTPVVLVLLLYYQFWN